MSKQVHLETSLLISWVMCRKYKPVELSEFADGTQKDQPRVQRRKKRKEFFFHFIIYCTYKLVNNNQMLGNAVEDDASLALG